MFKKYYQRFQLRRKKAGGLKNLLLYTAFALTLTSGLSYFLGLIRDRLFATRFGASSDLDMYNAAFVVPDFFLAFLVTSGLSAAFVPIFTQLDDDALTVKEVLGLETKAAKYTNQILSYALVILVTFCLLFALFLPQLADHLVPGFDSAAKADYVKITRLMLISPVLFTISNTFGNVLISKREFLFYGLAPVMYNVGIIIGVAFFVPDMGVQGLVVGTIIGAFLHLLIRLPAVLKYGFRFRFTFHFDSNMKDTVRLMIPKMFQIGMWQMLLLWFVRLASSLPEGSVTIYSFARNFQSVPVSLVGIAIALSAFATLSHTAAEKDYEKFTEIVKKRSLYVLMLTGASAIALAAISYPLIDILLGGGKFDDAAVKATALLLSVYCISVPLESVMHLLARAHYALKNTFRPSVIHITSIFFTITLSYVLIDRIELYAIPASFALGLTLQVLLLTFSLRALLEEKSKSIVERVWEIISGRVRSFFRSSF